MAEERKAVFDVWGDSYGRIMSAPAKLIFVDDSDAPYGYCRHLQRVGASNRREALAIYRSELNGSKRTEAQ
jgi:hypothetical protein